MIAARDLRRQLSLVILGLLEILPARAEAGDYTFRTIDYGLNTDTELYGINDQGLATGVTYDDKGFAYGIVVKDGNVSIIDPPVADAQGLYFYQVNAYGVVAGEYDDANGNSHAITYNLHTKKYTTLPDIRGYSFNAAGGINNAFEVAGNISADPSASTNLVGWIYTGGAYQFFVDPKSSQAMLGTITFSLNDAGTLVGFYVDPNGVAHGFKTPGSQGPFKTIDYPGADNTETYGINNFGTITGRYRVGDTRHGFLLSAEGRHTTVDVPGATQTWITAINDRGDLAGYYEDASGDYHGFVATRN